MDLLLGGLLRKIGLNNIANHPVVNSVNTFNKAAATDDTCIGSSGALVPGQTGWFTSEYTRVVRGSNIVFNIVTANTSVFYGLAFYDRDYVFISFISLKALNDNFKRAKVPANAEFYRHSDSGIANKDLLQIEYGAYSTDYKEYDPIKLNKIPFDKVLSSNTVDIYKDGQGTLHACLRNIYVRYANGHLFIYKDGLGNKSEQVAFNSTNFPGLIASSTVIKILLLPWSRNATTGYAGSSWRLNVITSNGQVYHNFPSRAAGSDGSEVSGDHLLFDEGCIWDMPDRWAPVKTNAGADATLIATGMYKYYPALPDASYTMYPAISTDNGYGNVGYPAVASLTDELGAAVKFARFHQPTRSGATFVSLDYMGGLIINEKMCAIGTYRSNTQATDGARIGVFYTNDGGRNWYMRYEFGPQGEIIGSTDNVIKAPVPNYQPTDLYAALTDAGASLYNVIKRSQYCPDDAVKEPTSMFKYSSPLAVSSIVASAAKITITTVTAHGLVSGEVIIFTKQGGAAANNWDWLVNTGHGANTAGDGMLFRVAYVNATSFTLKQNIHNPNNNLTARHIHCLNKGPHGIAIGCGETYPQGWIILHEYNQADSFMRLYPWDTFKFTRLTSSPQAVQRPLGFILRHDGTFLVGMDNESTGIGYLALPTGRSGNGVRKSSVGVFKGSLTGIDSLSNAVAFLDTSEVAYFFQEISGVIVFVGQQGHIAISQDYGQTWVQWKQNLPSALQNFGGQMYDRMFLINNYLFHIK